MQLKEDLHVFTGMQKDMSISKHPENFLYDANNIRITARDKDTLLSITNEKGPVATSIFINGSYLGHCLLNNYLVVFSTTSTDDNCTGLDYITRIDLATEESVILYNSANGNLHFSPNYLIEAITSYENADIQKVYWTDGFNQPRVINIVNDNTNYNSDSFDFVQELSLEENIVVTKLLGANGEFPAGVIQYAFTYFTKYGQESNIFHVTPLQYIAYKDRGGSPEAKIPVAFKIKLLNLDPKFNYIRVYSILRTSIDATPIVKKVQDVYYKSSTSIVSIIDTNYKGEDVDPSKLLYIGGEEIVAKTLDQKDGTLFFGNIEIKRPSIPSEIKKQLKTDNGITGNNNLITQNVTDYFSDRPYLKVSDGDISYVNTLLCSPEYEYKGVAGFKSFEYYRLAVQFQYKNGKWSEPCWIGDIQNTKQPTLTLNPANYNEDTALGDIPGFLFKMKTASQRNLLYTLYDAGYRKIRALYAVPGLQDRTRVCQGILNPVVYKRSSNYYQSSWVFRTKIPQGISDYNLDQGGIISPISGANYSPLFSQFDLEVTSNPEVISPYASSTEIMGKYDADDIFKIDKNIGTINSPDLLWDDSLCNIDFSNYDVETAGYAIINDTYGDIDIQTSSSTIGSSASGFIHKSIKTVGYGGLISGNYYNDQLVDKDDDGNFIAKSYDRIKFPIYLWHKSGSLNNDVSRTGRTSELLKKKISNYRFCSHTVLAMNPWSLEATDIQLFNSDELQLIKLKTSTEDVFYMGNIDTLLTPLGSPYYLAEFTDIGSTRYRAKIWDNAPNSSDSSHRGIWTLEKEGGSFKWVLRGYDDSGSSSDDDGYDEVKEEYRIGHNNRGLCYWKEPVSMKYKSTPHLVVALGNNSYDSLPESSLNIVEVTKPYDKGTMYGGTSDSAIENALWIPCGPAVSFDGNTSNLDIEFLWGDTYYQRFECLKTYAFTPEDKNQVVEIASVMLESRINMDGRYDRNRGQTSNLNMSPINFNLLNPVYSQKDNFFNYRLFDEDFYEINKFPNQITWSQEKQSGADTDVWTNVTLASVYDLDGGRGEITSLNTWKEGIYCFQTKGVSSLLFNSRVQIPTSDGTPIEISNNYKMDGYRYITNGVGCTNKWTIKGTPNGLYFIDSVSNNLFILTDKIENISESRKMSNWFRQNEIIKTLYDDVNKDLYFLTESNSLCFSEILGQFTSFMDYDQINLIESYNKKVFTMRNRYLYKMFEGSYDTFFGYLKPWHITFISNGNSQNLSTLNKVFSNIEYRMDIFDSKGDPITTESFDFIKVENEYQNTGNVVLNSANNKPSNLKTKFRVWRIDIPRNKKLDSFNRGKRDRITNPWCKITLGKNVGGKETILHDMNVKYYI